MDLGGIVVDVVALILPGVPGGAGVGLKAMKAARMADKAYDASRLTRGAHTAVRVGRGLDMGANTYQGLRSGAASYDSFSQGDYLGGTINLVGAGLGTSHLGIRGVQPHKAGWRVSFDNATASMGAGGVRVHKVDGVAKAKAFRAQGRPLVSVDDAGNVALNRPRGRRRQGVTTHIGFDEGRAQMWIDDLGRQQVVEFDIEQSFLDKVRKIAQPEHGVIRDRTKPWRVDVDYPDQYAFPPAMLDELEAAIIQGSGKIWK